MTENEPSIPAVSWIVWQNNGQDTTRHGPFFSQAEVEAHLASAKITAPYSGLGYRIAPVDERDAKMLLLLRRLIARFEDIEEKILGFLEANGFPEAGALYPILETLRTTLNSQRLSYWRGLLNVNRDF